MGINKANEVLHYIENPLGSPNIYIVLHRLLDLGYTMSEITRASQECDIVRKHREVSAKSFHLPFHAVLKAIERKMKHMRVSKKTAL